MNPKTDEVKTICRGLMGGRMSETMDGIYFRQWFVNAVRAAAFAIALVMLPFASYAASGAGYYPFAAGSARLSITFGAARAFDQSYTVFGIGGGYYIADGIEAGLDAESWSGSSPRIEEFSPQVRAVFLRDRSVNPYVGVFYLRTFIEGYRDLDTMGVRAGGYVLAGRNFYFAAGLAQEMHLDCDRNVYASCTEIYPELFFAVIF